MILNGYRFVSAKKKIQSGRLQKVITQQMPEEVTTTKRWNELSKFEVQRKQGVGTPWQSSG